MTHVLPRRSLFAVAFIFLLVLSSAAEQIQTDLPSQIRELNRALERMPRVADPARREAAAADMARVLDTRTRLIEKLIQTSPELIRSVMMSPASVSRVNVEAPAQATGVEAAGVWYGTLEATVADDFEHGRSTTQWYLHSGDKRRQLFFTKPQNANRHVRHAIIVTGVGTDNVIAVESVSRDTTVAESNPPSPTSCTSTGTENVAVLIMNQPAGGTTYPVASFGQSSFWEPIYFNSTASPQSANNFWQEASFGLTNLSGGTSDFYGPYTFTSAEDCNNSDALVTDAIAAAKTAGEDLSNSNYSRISIIYPVGSCSFGGLGTVGCYAADSRIGHPYSITWIPIINHPTAPVDVYTTSLQFWGLVAHELGHNLGLHHSSSLNFGSIPLGAIDYVDPYPTSTTASAGTPVRTEYGDPYTVMGNGSWTCGAQYTAFNKAEYLDWMNRTTDVQEITSTSGSFKILPFENTSGLRGLRILRDPLTSSWIWLEYRQALGDYDSSLSTCANPSNVLSGANVYYESPYSEDGHLFLLDMNAATTPNNFTNNALTPGNSWSDPYSLLTLHVTAADSTGVSVTTSYDAPCASLQVSNSGVFPAAGGSGTVTVTAPSTCSWTASTVDSWINITSGSSSSCNGSNCNGTVSFTVASNASNLEQRNGYITVQRQSVPVAQPGSSTFISNLSPTFQSGLSTVLNFTFNDPAGFADISYVTTKVHDSDCEVETVLGTDFQTWFMFLLDPATNTFSSSIEPGSALTASNANCTLNGATSSATNNGNQFQLSIGLTFKSSFAGSYRVTATAVDGANSSPSDISVGTFQVAAAPPPASISNVAPATGKQGFAVPIVITGSNTSFSGSSVVTITGTGITVSGVSAPSATQINATLTLAANAATGAQTLTVTTGSQVVTTTFTVNATGQALLSGASLIFGHQVTKTTSPSQQITLKNIGNGALNLTGITPSTNFGESDNCGSSLAVNATCTLNITFAPAFAGSLNGTISVADDSPSSPHLINVSGFGDLVVTLPGRPPRPARP